MRVLALAGLLVLLVVGSAWAEEVTELETLIADDNAYIRIDKASFDAMLKDYPEAQLRVKLVNDQCLAKMEAAMKAMNRLVYDGVRSQEAKDRKLWDDAKQKCWTLE